MFDRIMENSMAVWLLVSAAYPVFLCAMLIKAVKHFRARRPVPYGPFPREAALSRPEAEPALSESRARPDDWSPAR